MKIIIAGSRHIDPPIMAIAGVVDQSQFPVSEVVCGGARGVDKAGAAWAVSRNIPHKNFLPDWDKYGKRAGMLRNVEMGEYAEGLIAIWDGKSRGTQHMIEYMQTLNKPVYIFEVK